MHYRLFDLTGRTCGMVLLTLILAMCGTIETAFSDEAESAEAPSTLAAYDHFVTDLVFADANKLISVGRGTAAFRAGDVLEWDLATGKFARQFTGHEIQVWAVATSPDRKSLATADAAGKVIVWDYATGEKKTTLEAHQHWVRDVAFSPDGQHLVTCSEDTTARIWELGSGKQVGELAGHTSMV